MKMAFIGAGNMASALINGLLKNQRSPSDIIAVDTSEEMRNRCEKSYGVSTFIHLDEVDLTHVDTIVLAAKPQALREVATYLAPHLESQTVLSIAAGIRLDDLSLWLGGYRNIVRAMPNTPAQIGLGATGLAALPEVEASRKAVAASIMEAVGLTVWVNHESLLEAVTAVSGSGPAYVFYFIEALTEAGKLMGLSEEQSRLLAIATFNGASQLAYNSTEPPEILRQRVTSKGGTTAAAIAAFEETRVKEHIMHGAIAAKLRALEIGDEQNANEVQNKLT